MYNSTPDGWHLEELGAIASVNWGNTNITKASYLNHGYPAYSASGFDGYLHTFQFDENGMVLSAIGARCGRVFYASGKWTAIKNTITVLPKSGKSDLNFLFHFFGQPERWDIAGGAQPFIGLTNARKVEVLTPPITEQRKIATILSSVDDVIEKTRAQIDKLKDLKTGMMQELLTKGIGHTEFKDSPIGQIPASWQCVEIQEVLRAIIDYRGKSPPKSDGGIPLITAKNIRQGFIDTEPREFIYEKSYSAWMVRGIPRVGDLLITTEAPLGNVAKVPAYKFAIGQRVLALCPKDFVDPDYLLFAIQSLYFRQQLGLQSTGSTVAGIKQSTFRTVYLALAPKEEQLKIIKPLNSLNHRLESLKIKLDQLLNLKKALMQDLLTGKVRVKLDKESTINVY